MKKYHPAAGTHLSELDTPVLFLDIEAVEKNYKAAAETYKNTACKMRQHTKNIKSPLLALMQIWAGGTVGGVCTAKVAEAEVMVHSGVTDILIPNQVVTRDKIARMCSLSRLGDIKVCIDSEENLKDISTIAVEYQSRIGVLIEIDTQMSRAGVRDSSKAVQLAKLAVALPGVDFRGVMSHQALRGYKGEDDRIETARVAIQVCIDAKEAIEAERIEVEIVSSGETFSHDVACDMEGVTEVEGGTYALMGTIYGFMEKFAIANKVLSTVVSKPNDNTAIGDIGFRGLSWMKDKLPSVEGYDNISVKNLLEDHIVLESDGSMPLEVGQQFVILPYYQDIMVNRWDNFIVVRNDVVEDVWDIPGRGGFH